MDRPEIMHDGNRPSNQVGFITNVKVQAPFKKELDGVNAIYIFKEYPNATHAFSNPDATVMGKKFSIPIAYNEAADNASWNEMKTFLKRIFK
jgi:dienelactone hydrolase